mmetsp:Transcript_8253/g.24802  ORF Transcript_8253/g.24802 Transcript_8253/m.24802 type:complete len:564 (-) Transcript_8253:181-1872(-)|eukprot:CAMPEP_0198734316 /NCGR_PEP_ID=MMETSP1475-20131203/51722_1 /TAXON_ID= ORGANISM="Unidentified sp., Strain CCMP1999" /NCGR_SAMPLE_ID=MMETSP1475 /ASSEMBLY_ACC=CAM_ASM_001111 /LENGTH=563 /DNA_ID=CAMNT_0044497765 /DNA_START=146 /DNA_END=1837 /DNA_ORIENTATION=+
MSALHERLVSELRRRKVRLYAPPFATLMGEPLDIPRQLVQELSAGEDEGQVEEELRRIQSQALEKMRASYVHIRVKVLHDGRSAEIEALASPVWTATDLQRTTLSALAVRDVHESEAKVIVRGRTLRSGEKLRERNLKPGDRLLIIVSRRNREEEDPAVDSRNQRLQRLKSTVKRLSSNQKDRSGGGITLRTFFELSDSTGRPLDICPEDRCHLILALILQAEGRSAAAEDRYSDALFDFLEAENEYEHLTNRELLDHVDNHVSLALDVCWAAFRLGDQSFLQEGVRRLDIVRRWLNRNRTSDPARVTRSTGLRLRLLTLEAIISYHTGHSDDAIVQIIQAKNLLQRLLVSDTAVATVLEIVGCRQPLALYYLRICNGQVELAVSKILQHQDQKRAEEEAIHRGRARRERQRKFGRTACGSWVDVDLLRSLAGAGHAEEAAAAALRKADNDVAEALKILTGSQAQPSWSFSSAITPEGTSGEHSADAPTARAGRPAGRQPAAASSSSSSPSQSTTDDESEEDTEDLSDIAHLLQVLEDTDPLRTSLQDERSALNQYLTLANAS